MMFWCRTFGEEFGVWHTTLSMLAAFSVHAWRQSSGELNEGEHSNLVH
jgi:hypothetical protein